MPALFIRAVVTGFGMSLGTALFKKVQRQLGLAEEEAKKPAAEPVDPGEPGDGEPLGEAR